jgi:hypothetical protein
VVGRRDTLLPANVGYYRDRYGVILDNLPDRTWRQTSRRAAPLARARAISVASRATPLPSGFPS